MRVLLLGGTAEARELSWTLDELPGVDLVVALAGVTARPATYAGDRHVGGFGGSDGLARFLADAAIDVVVDATHPFAAEISRSAAEAADRCGIPIVRVVRPPWEPVDGDRWIEVDDVDGAAAALRRLAPSAALLALGRRHLDAFRDLAGIRLVVRSVDEPDLSDLVDAVAVVDRGPFDLADEVELLVAHGIGAVVARNSGGDDAKLAAARHLGIPVVLVRRPDVAAPAVSTVEQALAAVRRLSGKDNPG